MTFRNPVEAFEKAIKQLRLSANEKDLNYAGNYMYMGTDSEGIDLFKHHESRLYLP